LPAHQADSLLPSPEPVSLKGISKPVQVIAVDLR
jgi:hypothetical protein